MSTRYWCVRLAVMLTLLTAPCLVMAAGPAITKVAATPKKIVLTLGEDEAAPEVDGRLRIVELRAYMDYASDGDYPVVWKGKAARKPIRVDRFAGPRDRLYAKWQLVDDATGKPIGRPQYSTDLSALDAREFELTWPASKKGVTCIIGIEDAIETGTDISDESLILSDLIDLGRTGDGPTWTVDGVEVPICAEYLAELDERFKAMTDGGISFIPILVNHIPKGEANRNVLVHPDTDLDKAPMGHGIFNLTSEEGLRYFRAAVELVAHRYTHPDAKHGRIIALVVGNELQQHWVWANMGNAPEEKVIKHYTRAVRIAWLACQRYHRDLRVFISMDHHWAKRGYLNDPLKEIQGPALLRGINELAKAEGNFPWHVAFHPYPENLFEPRFWNDKTTWMRFDALRISFKNLEVLAEFLRQPEFLYKGKIRRIILSEQGFHTPDGPDGEKVQAAAFAYAYHKVKHMPEVDALIMHRHVDHPQEGGLRCGIWTWPPDRSIARGSKKFIWDVYRRADTPQWKEAFAFALPIIGIESWDEALPRYEVNTTPAPQRDEDSVIYDLHANLGKAKLINTEHFRSELVVKSAGWGANAIFQHPPATGPGDAVFAVELPELGEHDGIELTFETMLTGDSANGVHYSVLVDGKPRWDHVQTDKVGVAHTVDLTDKAGQRIALTLRVDSRGDATYDWSNWVEPTILFVEDESR